MPIEELDMIIGLLEHHVSFYLHLEITRLALATKGRSTPRGVITDLSVVPRDTLPQLPHSGASKHSDEGPAALRRPAMGQKGRLGLLSL